MEEAGVEEGGDARGGTDGHGDGGVERLQRLQVPGVYADCCQFVPELLPGDRIVGLLEVDEARPELLPASPRLLN